MAATAPVPLPPSMAGAVRNTLPVVLFLQDTMPVEDVMFYQLSPYLFTNDEARPAIAMYLDRTEVHVRRAKNVRWTDFMSVGSDGMPNPTDMLVYLGGRMDFSFATGESTNAVIELYCPDSSNRWNLDQVGDTVTSTGSVDYSSVPIINTEITNGDFLAGLSQIQATHTWVMGSSQTQHLSFNVPPYFVRWSLFAALAKNTKVVNPLIFGFPILAVRATKPGDSLTVSVRISAAIRVMSTTFSQLAVDLAESGTAQYSANVTQITPHFGNSLHGVVAKSTGMRPEHVSAELSPPSRAHPLYGRIASILHTAWSGVRAAADVAKKVASNEEVQRVVGRLLPALVDRFARVRALAPAAAPLLLE